jgi:hypothetical protein
VTNSAFLLTYNDKIFIIELDRDRNGGMNLVKLKEKICKKCKGTGLRILGDEWVGRKENICIPCNGTGTYWEGLYGYQIVQVVPEKFLILNKGDIWYLYLRKLDGIYLWAKWSVGTIRKMEEVYEEYLENIDELEELEEDLKLLIALFYESDEQHIFCEGKPYSELEDGYLEFAINNK